MDFTFAFLEKLLWGLYFTLPPLLFLCLMVVSLGLVVGRIEGWNRFDSVYWAFITALTVGYGDIRPSRKLTKVLALLIAVIGIMLFGIIVAIAVTTFTSAFNESIQLPETVSAVPGARFGSV